MALFVQKYGLSKQVQLLPQPAVALPLTLLSLQRSLLLLQQEEGVTLKDNVA